MILFSYACLLYGCICFINPPLYSAQNNPQVIWEEGTTDRSRGLILRLNDFFEDIFKDNPNILKENYNPEHLSYDIGDDIDPRQSYVIYTIIDIDQFERMEPYDALVLYKNIKSIRIQHIKKANIENETLYYVIGEITFNTKDGNVAFKLNIPIHEEKGGNKNLRLTYTVRPLTVG